MTYTHTGHSNICIQLIIVLVLIFHCTNKTDNFFKTKSIYYTKYGNDHPIFSYYYRKSDKINNSNTNVRWALTLFEEYV